MFARNRVKKLEKAVYLKRNQPKSLVLYEKRLVFKILSSHRSFRVIFLVMLSVLMFAAPGALQAVRAQSIISTISSGIGTTPYRFAIDPSNGNVYVSNVGGSSLSVISDSSNTVTRTANLSQSPNGVAFDSSNGNVYVTLPSANSVAVISGSSGSLV